MSGLSPGDPAGSAATTSVSASAGRRVTLEEVAREAGVSLSTVDRLLNARAPVRSDTAERVRVAAERLGFRASGVIEERTSRQRPRCTFGFLLQRPASGFYRALAQALTEATEVEPLIRGQAHVEYLDDLAAEAVAARMLALGATVDALAVVAADHPLVDAAIERLHEQGVPVYALVSDLGSPLRAGHAGPDSRRIGRSAAWFITRLARTPGRIAIFVGTHRFQCQELAEMSFRSYVREHAPQFEVLEPLLTLDSAPMAAEGMRALLQRHPDLCGFYVDGGGIEGVLAALREARARGDLPAELIGVAHELTPETRAALRSGELQAVLSMPRPLLAQRLVRRMAEGLLERRSAAQDMPLQPAEPPLRRASIVVPLETWTPESV